MFKKAFVLTAITIVCWVAVLAGCGNQGQSGFPNEVANNPSSETVGQKGDQSDPVKIPIGLIKLTAQAPLFVGMEKGFFQEEHIELVPQWFDASQPLTVAVASGSVDVGATGFTASFFNMIAGGQKFWVLADKGREIKGYSAIAVVVPADSPLQSVQDLKGKKVGVTQIGSTYHYMAIRLMEKYGMDISDVEIVPLNTLGALSETLRSKQVDAIFMSEPNVSTILKEGYGRVLVHIGEEFDYQVAGLFASEKFIKNKDVAVRFLKAYAKSTRYYHDAVLAQKDGVRVPGENYEEVVDIIAKHTGVSPDAVISGLLYLDRNGRLLAKDIGTQIDYYSKHNLIEKWFDYKEIVNTELLEEALKELGE